MMKCKDEKPAFDRVVKMKDDAKKLLALSDFMIKVVPVSYYWNLARSESQRLEKIGISIF